MNIQTERLENHTAKLTVEVDPNELEEAKRSAAKSLAKRVNVPGFRKGKAPYRLVVNYVGEPAILEEAIEILGQKLYSAALKDSAVEPYAPGSLDDFKLDPPTFTFSVPLVPTADLGDYRSIRLDYTAPTVEDKQVDDYFKGLQEEQAVVEESTQPARMGDRVTVDVHGIIVDENTDPAEAPDEPQPDIDVLLKDDDHVHDDDEDEAHEHDHDDDKIALHSHDAGIVLDEEHEPVPGFAAALEGINAGEARVFELTYPDDSEEYDDMAGKRAKFYVTAKKVENITLPELTDDFAARITEKEETPLTLLELRVRVREDLQKQAEEHEKNTFYNKVLDQIVEQGTFGFPEDLIEDQIDFMLRDFDQYLRRQGVNLSDYQRLSGKTDEQLHADYREPAIRAIKRGLVVQELQELEQITVTDETLQSRIDEMSTRFGAQAESFRALFDNPNVRENVRNDMLEEGLRNRMVAIARGENPDLQPEVTEPTTSESEEVTETETGESA